MACPVGRALWDPPSPSARAASQPLGLHGWLLGDRKPRSLETPAPPAPRCALVTNTCSSSRGPLGPLGQARSAPGEAPTESCCPPLLQLARDFFDFPFFLLAS